MAQLYKSFFEKLKYLLPNASIKIFLYIILYLKFLAFILITDSLSDHDSKIVYILYWGIWSLFIWGFISFANLFKKRGANLYLFVLNFLVTSLLIFDLWAYRSFSNFVSLYLTKQTANLDNTWTSILSMARPIDALFLPDLFVFFFIIFNSSKNDRSDKRGFTGFILIFLICLSGLFISNEAMSKLRGEPLFKLSWTPNLTIYKLSPIGFHLMDAYEFYFESSGIKLSNIEKNEIKNFISAQNENLPDNEFAGFAKGQNLLIIQVESLENFVINRKINNQEITPNLNRLTEKSYYFPNLMEQTNLGGSSDADFMVNTSILPLRSGAIFFRFPDNTYNSLPKILASESYFSQAIKSDKPSFYNWKTGLMSLGFDKIFDKNNFNSDELFLSGLSDSSLLFQSVKFIEKAPKPFYTFLVTITSHNPFIVPNNQKMLKLSSPLKGTKMEDYFQSIHYTDKQIAAFLKELDKRGLLENTLVVLYGDHTGVHKFFGDVVSQIKPSEDWWAKQEYKLPLIVYSKKINQPKKIETYGGQLDVAPTILYALGIDKVKYESTMFGRNLFNTNKNYSFTYMHDLVGKFSEADRINSKTAIELSDKVIKSAYFGKFVK